jgi:hypothetical protein
MFNPIGRSRLTDHPQVLSAHSHGVLNPSFTRLEPSCVYLESAYLSRGQAYKVLSNGTSYVKPSQISSGWPGAQQIHVISLSSALRQWAPTPPRGQGEK